MEIGDEGGKTYQKFVSKSMKLHFGKLGKKWLILVSFKFEAALSFTDSGRAKK